MCWQLQKNVALCIFISFHKVKTIVTNWNTVSNFYSTVPNSQNFMTTIQLGVVRVIRVNGATNIIVTNDQRSTVTLDWTQDRTNGSRRLWQSSSSADSLQEGRSKSGKCRIPEAAAILKHALMMIMERSPLLQVSRQHDDAIPSSV